MRAESRKLRMASDSEIIREIYAINNEVNNAMYPVSYARYKELEEYKVDLVNELHRRGMKL